MLCIWLLFFEYKMNLLLILGQYIVVYLLNFVNFLLLVFFILEFFTIILVLLLLNSRFGFRIIGVWYLFTLNLLLFILLFLILYYMLLDYCTHLYDNILVILENEYNGSFNFLVFCLFNFKFYNFLVLNFLEQLYVRLGVYLYLYMLSIYLLFIFIFYVWLKEYIAHFVRR